MKFTFSLAASLFATAAIAAPQNIDEWATKHLDAYKNRCDQAVEHTRSMSPASLEKYCLCKTNKYAEGIGSDQNWEDFREVVQLDNPRASYKYNEVHKIVNMAELMGQGQCFKVLDEKSQYRVLREVMAETDRTKK